MKKITSLLFLICFSIISFGQTQSYKGFYQTKFFNVFGEVKVIEAEFEVKDNNVIVGKLKIGNESKILQGKVEQKGKFEARTELENGVVTLIKGEFPITKNEGKVSLITRTEQKGKGSKSTSESGISGFITQTSPPIELKDVGITDNGKTQMWFQHSNMLFGKEWIDYPATVKVTNYSGLKAFEGQMKLETAEAGRRFHFRMVVKQEAQKVWTAKELGIASYTEKKGENLIGYFGTKDAMLSGQIEVISEDNDGVVFKITNLQIKTLSGNESVQIDGYIYAAKIP